MMEEYLKQFHEEQQLKDLVLQTQDTQGLVYLQNGVVIAVEEFFVLFRNAWIQFKTLKLYEAPKEDMIEFFDNTTAGGILIFGKHSIDITQIMAMTEGQLDFNDEDDYEEIEE